jgi:hypothetical protein
MLKYFFVKCMVMCHVWGSWRNPNSDASLRRLVMFVSDLQYAGRQGGMELYIHTSNNTTTNNMQRSGQYSNC